MPHLRELVKLHKDDPFALIGINTGDSEADYRKGLEDYEVTWLSAYQGRTTPIADLYSVRGYPTYVLIDAEGKVVQVGHSGELMDEPIKRLLAKLSSASSALNPHFSIR